MQIRIGQTQCLSGPTFRVVRGKVLRTTGCYIGRAFGQISIYGYERMSFGATACLPMGLSQYRVHASVKMALFSSQCATGLATR